MLRLWGDFNDVSGDTEGNLRVFLSNSPESWSGRRLEGQLRDGLRVIVDDGQREVECILQLDSGDWFGRIVGQFHDSAKGHPS